MTGGRPQQPERQRQQRWAAEVGALLDEEEWRELLPRLLLYALRISGDAATSEDLVQEALSRVLGGQRRWQGKAPQSRTELELLLSGTVKSLGSHHRERLRREAAVLERLEPLMTRMDRFEGR